MQPGAVCESCGGSGYYRLDVPFDDPRFGKIFPCECRTADYVKKLQAVCGLTASERTYRLEQIAGAGNTAEMIEAARAFIEQPSGIITIWGTTGNAKSVALMSIVNECVERQIPAVYVTGFALLEFIKQAFDEKNQNATAFERLERFQNVPVLCIDEFDKVKFTEWALAQITNLVDTRYRRGLEGDGFGTVLAMNEDPVTLPEWIYSRLQDGRNRIIHNGDPDMRPLMR